MHKFVIAATAGVVLIISAMIIPNITRALAQRNENPTQTNQGILPGQRNDVPLAQLKAGENIQTGKFIEAREGLIVIIDPFEFHEFAAEHFIPQQR